MTLANSQARLTEDEIREVETGLSNMEIVGERAAPGVLEGLDIGNRGTESSKDTPGLSPFPKNQ